jgi:hypothetical protein
LLNGLKRVSKQSAKASKETVFIQFGRHVFLEVFNILKPLSFEARFHRREQEKRSTENWNCLDKSG